MRRTQAVLGLLAGITLLLSALVHLFIGWPQLKDALLAPQLSTEIVSGVRTIWIFAGVAMGAFGIIVLKIARQLWFGNPNGGTTLVCIGFGYTAFGGWTLFASGFDPFFFVFLLPGVALLFAGLAPPNLQSK